MQISLVDLIIITIKTKIHGFKKRFLRAFGCETKNNIDVKEVLQPPNAC